jgi:hypothetical protein
VKRIALAAIAALALAGIWATTATSETNSTHHITPSTHSPPPRHCTIDGFRPFSEAVWRLGAWKRGTPPVSVLEARTAALACATPPHRAAMRRTWRRDAAAFLAHRRHMVWLETMKPFVYPDGTRWAVPFPIAWCESGGNYFVGPSGAYGLIPPLPQYMSPAEQDRVAHELYVEHGEGPWAPFETACIYR